MNSKIYRQLAGRIGEEHLIKRRTRQANLAARIYIKGGYPSFHWENIKQAFTVLKYALKLSGLYKRGQKNTLEYRVEEIPVILENLPQQFDDFRILHLADLHADKIFDKGRKLIDILSGLQFDLCVLTGDFSFHTRGVYDEAMGITGRIIRAIDASCGVWGILGNHDYIEFVPELEAMGMTMLLNETAPIRKDGAEVWLAGIDDAHLYDCHDIPKALSQVPDKALKILLSHTPATYAEAAEAGVDYFLSGHTHGGQICLPWGAPVFTNTRCPRKYCSGAWSYKGMHGYTSRAVGCSGLPVRFFCPPEITIHVLRKKI